jgi:hypothetical protein
MAKIFLCQEGISLQKPTKFSSLSNSIYRHTRICVCISDGRNITILEIFRFKKNGMATIGKFYFHPKVKKKTE